MFLIDTKGGGLPEHYMRAHAKRFGFDDLEEHVIHFDIPEHLPGFAFFNIQPALEYGSVSSYKNTLGEEWERWTVYFAQRFETPNSQIMRDNWERANNWKIPSLAWTSLDAGIRPIEVEKALAS